MARIPDAPEEIFDEFTEDYKAAFEQDLTSVILYGSGAKGEYIRGKSDINFLIVLTSNGIENLDKALDLIPKWRKRNVSVPLFLTEGYIQSALDAFAIEFLNMQKHYRLVFGNDVLESLEISKNDLRLQIERELRGKLLHLREGFLSTGQDRDSLREMLSASVAAFASIFEALLYLKEDKVPASKAEVFKHTAEKFGLEMVPFSQLLNIKRGEWRGSKVQLRDLTKMYIRQVRKLVELVDKM
ncbi:hypothetical protein GWO43_02990 [candidate division KSB1 bacterium]|nr:hypothetical protein [candidate division KSB1 bacterium]NIR69992.1 hypothetical protein [candidate division KSB1 bacterium]NIS23015.1 hypothetical protein [candidate division KSB1 bacterium]NIT69873.1 hypothetical protein [candidate division KSB1 bacterium]NIU23522.1 hypothetical protein [candidate division KSB1 bacterium]